jgi:hypothetical protein
MRFLIIVIAMSLASGSTAIAQKSAPALPTQEQAAAEKENPSWYRENAPYGPCPVVASIMAGMFVLAAPPCVPGLRPLQRTLGQPDKKGRRHRWRGSLFKEQPIYEQSAVRTVHEQPENGTCV